jgi:RHS repeat-associated protein
MFDYHYNATNFRLDQETVSYLEQATAGTYALVRTISHPTDGLDRPTGFNITYGSPVTSDGSATVAYSATTGRIATVSGASMGTFTYSYAPNSNLVSKIDTGSFSRNYTYESTRDVMDTVENDITSPATVVSKYDYTVNDLTQRTAVTTSGTAFSGSGNWAWGYNDRDEVTSADSSLGTFDRAYAFDSIGNRTTSVEGSLTLGSPNYVANSINQYTTIPTGTAPTFDLDGNETSGRVRPIGGSEANATMTWDAENRLASATTSGTTTRFLYDPYGRKMLRQIPGGPDGFRYAYLYDGWNDIKQYYVGTSSTISISGYQTNLWGPDMSGSWSGAGGVGGLLATRGGPVGHTYVAAYDGNGNVTEYLDASGATPVLSAHFEYDAFGKTLKDNDTNQIFDHRFSTKQVDWNTGLSYYGYRWYDSIAGKWISRDPSEEEGGINLYCFVENNPNGKIDPLGLSAIPLPDWGDFNKIPCSEMRRIIEYVMKHVESRYDDMLHDGWWGRIPLYNNPNPPPGQGTWAGHQEQYEGFRAWLAKARKKYFKKRCNEDDPDLQFISDLNKILARPAPKTPQFPLAPPLPPNPALSDGSIILIPAAGIGEGITTWGLGEGASLIPALSGGSALVPQLVHVVYPCK